MNEYPVFIPSDGKRIAAVVTIPSGSPPRAVVVFTTGGGSTLRSQRFRLWTRAARALAEIGIASVRMEFAGVGDSTGEVVMGFDNLPVDTLIDVARFAMRATGTDRLGLCGNCGGARTALKAVAELSTCESMVLFWLKPLARTVRGRPLTHAGVRVARRLPSRPRRALASLYFKVQERSRRGNDVLATLRAVDTSIDLLLVETRSKLAGEMPRVVDGLRAASGERRVEMRGVNSTSMRAFQSLDDQAETVVMVIDWFDRSFSREPSTSGAPAPGTDEPAADDLAVRPA